MSSTFLPSDYEAPSESGRYMRLKKGDNRFRVLGSAITGNEYWKEKDGKRYPVRVRTGVSISVDELESGDGQPVKHFWAFPVWNYAESSVQILELTQKSVRKELQALVDDEDWGDPRRYDVSVTREGDGMETTYTVKPKPAKELSEAVQESWKEVVKAGFDLSRLYDGGDPFSAPAEAPAPTRREQLRSQTRQTIAEKAPTADPEDYEGDPIPDEPGEIDIEDIDL